MASNALAALSLGLVEVSRLLSADPTPPGRIPANPTVARVVGRAAVVLLSSHFERYVHAANEEAAAVVNARPPAPTALSVGLRLQHSRGAVDAMAETEWTNRSLHLEAFVANEGWLWGSSGLRILDPDRLIDWMRTPLPKELNRYYSLWGIRDVFTAMTRMPHTRSSLWLRLEDLVRKRNAIAHGDATAEATKADVLAYVRAATTFCDRADRILASQLYAILGPPRPW